MRFSATILNAGTVYNPSEPQLPKTFNRVLKPTMALLSRDVVGYVDPNEVVDGVKSRTITGYLTTIVAALLVYDAGKQASLASLSMADASLDSMHIRPGGGYQSRQRMQHLMSFLGQIFLGPFVATR